MTEKTLQETTRQTQETIRRNHKDGEALTAFTFRRSGQPRQVDRTIMLTLSDQLRILPESFSARRRETLRIIVSNPGALKHWLLIADADFQHEHSLMWHVAPSSRPESVNALSTDPGESRDMHWMFNGPDDVYIACHSPDHT